MQVSPNEILKLVQGFDNADTLASAGVTLAGQRYIYLSGSERIIRAKLGRNGVHCMKTAQGMLKIVNNNYSKNKKIEQQTIFHENKFVCSFAHLAVLITIYEDPVQPQQAASIVEKLGDYLITCGY